MVTVLGVDACPGGWLTVELRDGCFAEARAVTTLRSLLPVAASGGVAVVAVDMPLGLLETGWRRADTEAAALLGPLRGSVFRVPPRAVWLEATYAAAAAWTAHRIAHGHAHSLPSPPEHDADGRPVAIWY
ncbi:DUF429 domain-containing protein [Streptomyces sioyaensis]|uniref:DUF429 domain-containing protein n=1 Tax=Streptomyces sioyaensis TaxID=67364 RepID=UPI00365D1754